MARFYLDVETFREKEAFDERIIAIGVLEDWTPYQGSSLEKEAEFRIFSEWDLGNEKQVVKVFYSYFKDLLLKSEFLVIVGFNILRFDIPLLIQKAVEHGLAQVPELNKLWYEAYVIDLFQAALLTNEMRFKGNSLKNLVKKAKDKGIQVSEIYGKGDEVKEWYKKKEYSKIEEKLKADLKIIRELDLTQSIYRIIKLND